MSLFSLFLLTSLANILSPGMGVIFAIVLSLQQGWHKTVFFSLGQAVGISILFTAAMSGMGVILASSPTLFAENLYVLSPSGTVKTKAFFPAEAGANDLAETFVLSI